MATFSPSTSINSHGKLQWGTTRFVALPHAAVTHPTYRELSGGAIKLLLALLSNYVGNNNGHLTATFSRMKEFGFNSKDSLARAIRELLAFGYIVRTRSNCLRSPALYGITWLPLNRAPARQPYDAGIIPGDEASDAWRHIDPCKAKGMAVARKLPVVPSPTTEALH